MHLTKLFQSILDRKAADPELVQVLFEVYRLAEIAFAMTEELKGAVILKTIVASPDLSAAEKEAVKKILAYFEKKEESKKDSNCDCDEDESDSLDELDDMFISGLLGLASPLFGKAGKMVKKLKGLFGRKKRNKKKKKRAQLAQNPVKEETIDNEISKTTEPTTQQTYYGNMDPEEEEETDALVNELDSEDDNELRNEP